MEKLKVTYVITLTGEGMPLLKTAIDEFMNETVIPLFPTLATNKEKLSVTVKKVLDKADEDVLQNK